MQRSRRGGITTRDGKHVMFVSWRDILFAKGRVALVAAVVGLITLLLVLLTGLTGGLGQQNTSALERLDAQRIVFSTQHSGDEDPSFTTSRIDSAQLRAWRGERSVAHADPLVVGQGQLEAADTAASAAVFGLPQDSTFRSQLDVLEGRDAPGAGAVVLSHTLAEDLGVSLGDEVSIAGKSLRVGGISADEYYSHTPVVWAADRDALAVTHQPRDVLATAVLVDFTPALSSGDVAAAAQDADRDAGTVSTDTRGAFSALPAYNSEHGSLVSMQAFLYVISALVTVSFITVWTVQRTRDIAVLRALGASRGYLFRDALGQAAIVVSLGALAGLAVGAAGGFALTGLVPAIPFHVSAGSVLIPAAGVIVLGVLGSVLAVRRVSSVDPLIALGGN